MKWFHAVAAITALGIAGCVGLNDTSLKHSPGAGPTPVAVINASATYDPLATAVFDGSGSWDSDAQITDYQWEMVVRPSGSQSQLLPQPADPAFANFFIDLAGDYTVKLTVKDSQGQSDAALWAFSAIPTQDLHVELMWPAQYGLADMDLHLIDASAGGVFNDALLDCYFANCRGVDPPLDWGQASNVLDNPSLDIDNIGTQLPENDNIRQPADGTYEVDVHYFNTLAGSNIPVDCEVRIYLGGGLARDAHRTLVAPGQVWHVADVICSSGNCSVVSVPDGCGNPHLPCLTP